jgi:hypothetical protein
MWTRRQFLSRSGLAALGAAGTCFAFPGDNGGGGLPRDGGDRLDVVPDGSASKDMITQEADRAIETGLACLASRQRGDGSYGTGSYTGNVAVTSLAALAFMAHGDQPHRGPYGKIISAALRFVLDQSERDRNRGFLHNPRDISRGPMYGHGFGTLFLAEVSGMVHDKALREELNEKLHDAVKLILNGQNLEGGWRYNPGDSDADISVTICQIMALRAARNAGIAVPRSKVDKCVEYVKSCQNRRKGWFQYMKQQPGGGGPQGFARTAAGICALYSAGIYSGPEIEAALKFLRNSRPRMGFDNRDMHFFYGHYYAVQAMWTAGGDYWTEWYPAIRDELVRSQANDSSWRDQICTHYATAMACIILQMPNNYLPILQK